ncbi:MAG: 4-hydroxybenzoate octaprenyltransferase [Gammaproteobacteria bacterium]
MANAPARTAGERFSAYLRLIRFDRPIGTLLLLWPTLWALWLAGAGRPDPHVFVVFVVGVLVMRSAGCAINDYADRDFDAHVERTQGRPLATGEIAPREALAVFFILLLVAFGLVVTLGWPMIKLSMIGAVLAATYPFFKRFTHVPQLYLGAAFGWGIPMAFAAQTGSIPLLAWVLFAANVLWATAYDTMYAMADRKDDLRIGVKSTAVLLGRYDRLAVGVLQVLTMLLLIWVGVLANLGVWYAIGLALAATTCVYQQFLIRDRHEKASFDAFINNSWFGAAVYCGVLLHYTFAS